MCSPPPDLDACARQPDAWGPSSACAAPGLAPVDAGNELRLFHVPPAVQHLVEEVDG
jgi:hypothetical protein